MKNNEPQIDRLLDSLVQHGKNARRQEKLMAQIDHLEAAEKRHRLFPVWISATIAATIALILIIRPADNQVAKVLPLSPLPQTESPLLQQPATIVTDTPKTASSVPPKRASAMVQNPPAAMHEDSLLQQELQPLEQSSFEEYICLADTEIDTIPMTPSEPEFIIVQTHSLVACDRKRKIPTIDKPEKDLFGNPIVNEMPLFALNF